jgi:hypothetical protein
MRNLRQEPNGRGSVTGMLSALLFAGGMAISIPAAQVTTATTAELTLLPEDIRRLGGNLRSHLQLDLVMRAAVPRYPELISGPLYSAGSCILGPTLDGIHLVDPPDLPAKGYGTEIIWEGLGFLPYSIAPHFKSDHPESAMIDGVVEYFEARGLPYLALRDGESIVIPE